MVSGPDHMGAPSSFTARRPNASHLPSFELPPPPVRYPTYSHVSSAQSMPTSSNLTSVGNLLTPPSHGSNDGLSPGSLSSTTSLSSHGAVPPFAQSAWQPHSTGSTPYGFQSASTAQGFSSSRPIYSPSLGATIRGTGSPTASEGLPPPPPPYEMSSYSQSMPMSAPNLPALPTHHSMSAMMNGQHTRVSAPLSQASPVSAHDGFSRPPPTPTANYYPHTSSNPQQGSFSYSTGPSPIAQSPMSAGGSLGKMSPVHQSGQVPSLQAQNQQQYSQHRPYSSYQMPVLSNVNNPNGQLALVGPGMPHGMVPAFNSGHAAQMHAMYGGHTQQPNPQNDRPFRCDQCPQSFNRNHDLKRHKRIHLAVKPFPCGHCDKSFSRKDALKRHVLVKGCGKASSTTEVKELDGSLSPKSEEHSPVTSVR